MGMEREAEDGGRSLRTPADQEGREGGGSALGEAAAAQSGHRWDPQQVLMLLLSFTAHSLGSHFSRVPKHTGWSTGLGYPLPSFSPL